MSFKEWLIVYCSGAAALTAVLFSGTWLLLRIMAYFNFRALFS